MTRTPTDIGLRNRTGIQASPFDWKKTAESAQAGTPVGTLDVGEISRIRIELSRNVDPVGTMPAPLSMKGAAGTVATGVKGEDLAVFLDILGERLGFERRGVRCYDALLCKHAAAHLRGTQPSAEDLNRIRADEMRHLALLVGVMEKLGGDATALTPCADIMAVATQGVMQVLTDPRTTFTQGMRAILMIEQTDQAGWESLVRVADRMGMDDLGRAFRHAMAQEEEHVRLIRTWLNLTLESQAG